MAYRCVDEVAKGGRLCRAHQRRLDRGGGLPTSCEKFPGDSSGHGLFGFVDRNDSGVLCHECGQRFAALAPHVLRTHTMEVAAYRHLHGLDAAESLAMPRSVDGLPRRRPHPCNRCGTEVTTSGKLCANCGQERKVELERRRNAEAKPKRPRWRPLSEKEQAELLAAGGDELAVLVQMLQRDRVPSREIGDVLGRSRLWMSQHHPGPGWGEKA